MLVLTSCFHPELTSDSALFPQMEYELSSIFVRTSFSGDGAAYDYGTRSSTVVLVNRKGSVTIVEWSRGAGRWGEKSSSLIASCEQRKLGPDETIWERREVTIDV